MVLNFQNPLPFCDLKTDKTKLVKVCLHNVAIRSGAIGTTGMILHTLGNVQIRQS